MQVAEDCKFKFKQWKEIKFVSVFREGLFYMTYRTLPGPRAPKAPGHTPRGRALELRLNGVECYPGHPATVHK